MVDEVAGNWKKEAIRNIELHWLLEGLAPNYHIKTVAKPLTHR